MAGRPSSPSSLVGMSSYVITVPAAPGLHDWSGMTTHRGFDQGNTASRADPGAGSRCRPVSSQWLGAVRLRQVGPSIARRGDRLHSSHQVGGGNRRPLRIPARHTPRWDSWRKSSTEPPKSCVKAKPSGWPSASLDPDCGRSRSATVGSRPFHDQIPLSHVSAFSGDCLTSFSARSFSRLRA
jgi:hypothetical protein